ncbi:hypothetical protein MKZ38_004030 [Zalerion maritima]|uniref:Uncharacterized protein n=1 Tax=Zalerion maritima TaxID=339359 RepID=A0AAD5RNC7_9PEZI|nr:hypothetical protein MKZ38_004030 [Zalerion maritima]
MRAGLARGEEEYREEQILWKMTSVTYEMTVEVVDHEEEEEEEEIPSQAAVPKTITTKDHYQRHGEVQEQGNTPAESEIAIKTGSDVESPVATKSRPVHPDELSIEAAPTAAAALANPPAHTVPAKDQARPGAAP